MNNQSVPVDQRKVLMDEYGEKQCDVCGLLVVRKDFENVTRLMVMMTTV